MASSPFVVDIAHVTKRYRRGLCALDDVSMQIAGGEVFGLLGPNGAGKSTLVKILTTVIRPTRVEGTLLGRPIGWKPSLRQLGYLPEQPRYPDYLTGRQMLHHNAALAKIDRTTRRRRAGELLEAVHLSRWADRRIATYSKGMRQRIGLAQALMNDPRLVLLDEPTDGLDPVGRTFVRDLLIRLRSEGRTVLLNSHLLSEVEQVCDRVAIMKAGKIVQMGRLKDLTAGTARYVVTAAGPEEAEPLPIERLHTAIRDACPAVWSSGDLESLKVRGRLRSGPEVRLEGAALEVDTESPYVMQEVIDRLREAGLLVVSMQPIRQTLEDLFFGAVVADPKDADFTP